MTGGEVGGAVAVEALKFAWENKTAIQKRIDKITEWWADRKLLPVLLIGAGGVGKTTLSNLLAGEYDLLVNPPGEYDESLGVEKVKIALSRKGKGKSKDRTKIRAEIVIAPGQKRHRGPTWTDYERDISSGKVRGVILFGCYGYHSLGVGIQSHGLYSPRAKIEDFVSQFVSEQRREEVDVLARLAPSIIASPGRMWVLSLVTKQDLWIDEKNDVENFYERGDYGQLIDEIHSKKGVQNFRHEFSYASLVISKFVDKRNKVLKLNTAGYDQGMQTNSLRHVFEAIYALREWENKK